MSGEFLVNPRRSPRAPARCRARIEAAEASWEAPTEDIGPRGCQVILPSALVPDARVQVTLRSPALADALEVAGRVAWVAPNAPFRAGIAFVEGAVVAATRWFDGLVAAQPELGGARSMPSHLPLDAMVFLGRPPRYLFDFTPDEAAVLRHVASGVTVRELRHVLRGRGDAATRAFFSLLARQHLTLARGASVHPLAWRQILSDLEVTFAANSLSGPRPPPLPRMAPAPPRETTTASRPLAPRAASRRAADMGWAGETEPTSSYVARTGRSPEAQGAFERALAERASGRTETALILLRRASALAPNDAEIGRELAETSFLHQAEH